MNKIAILFLLSTCPFHICKAQESQRKQEVDYVNTIIGTPFAGFAEGLEGGGTLPAVGRPYSMTNFLAQTGESKMGRTSYVYEDKSIMGFLASHQPTVWMGDYGYVSVMPQVGELKLLPKEKALTFSHKDEVTRPYYYSVLLDAPGNQKIKTEIAAASRAAIFQFTFPATEKAHLIIHRINLNPDMQHPSNDYQHILTNIKP